MLRYLGKEMNCIKTIARNILGERNWLENISLLLLISWFGSELYLREKNGGFVFVVFYLFQVHIILVEVGISELITQSIHFSEE